MGEKQGGRYGALIKQAKQTQPESQISGLPGDQTSGDLEGPPIQKPVGQISGLPDNQISGQLVPEEKQVNLCVKVPESLRRHWAIQAKIQGVTMTAVMVEALTERFGKPDSQIAR